MTQLTDLGVAAIRNETVAARMMAQVAPSTSNQRAASGLGR